MRKYFENKQIVDDTLHIGCVNLRSIAGPGPVKVGLGTQLGRNRFYLNNILHSHICICGLLFCLPSVVFIFIQNLRLAGPHVQRCSNSVLAWLGGNMKKQIFSHNLAYFKTIFWWDACEFFSHDISCCCWWCLEIRIKLRKVHSIYTQGVLNGNCRQFVSLPDTVCPQ